MEDIHYTIGSAIEDVFSLINYCSTNNNARRLCGTRAFWENQFNRFNLPLEEDVYYTDSYQWVQLLLKTKYVMDQLNTLNQLFNIKTVLLKVNIPLSNIIDIMEDEGDIIVNNLQNFFDDDYDDDKFKEAINDRYPFIINEIMLIKRGTRYYLSLIINKNIENIPGGINILQDSDEIVFTFPLKFFQLENIMIKLIPYL